MFKPIKVVIHELQKSPEYEGIKWVLSDTLSAVKPSDYVSLEKMIKSFDREGVFYGHFGKPDEKPFVETFLAYFTSAKNEHSFILFTKLVANQLDKFLDKKNFARGGYYVFCEYENDGSSGLGIFLVRDTEGTLFKLDPSSNSFQLDKIKYMETDKMAMGCQIDYIKYRSEGQKCLAFTHNRQKEVADYFVQWVGCQDRKSDKESTEDFYKLLDAIKHELPVDSETGEAMTSDKLRVSVFNLVESQQNKKIDLLTVGKHIFEDTMFLINKAKTHKIEIDTEFKLHKGTVTKRSWLEVKDDELGIKLKFPRHQFGERSAIKVRKDGNKQMLIINSPLLIDQIVKALEK